MVSQTLHRNTLTVMDTSVLLGEKSTQTLGAFEIVISSVLVFVRTKIAIGVQNNLRPAKIFGKPTATHKFER